MEIRGLRAAVVVLVVAGLLVPGAARAAATTRYASPDGSGDCSSADSPCPLAQANAASAAGDTIFAEGGRYDALGDVTITPGVDVVGIGAREPFFGSDPASNGVTVLPVGTLTLTGGVLRDVMVHGTVNADGTRIERAYLVGNEGPSAAACRFAGLVARDVTCASRGAGPGVEVSGSTELRNVTATSVSGDGVVVDGPASVLVHNTSAQGARSLVVGDPGAAVAVDHSQIGPRSAPDGTTTLGPGNVGFDDNGPAGITNCDVLSVHWAIGRPPSGSPAIDAGGAVDPTEEDVLGAPRALGAAPDIGAYEYVPRAPCSGVVTATPTATGATLSVPIGAGDDATTYHFEWGPTEALGSSSPSGELPVAAAPKTVSATIGGLTPGTTYFVQVEAVNGHGEGGSPVATFTTAAAPSSPAADTTPSPSPATRPKPKVTIHLPRAGHCRTSRTLAVRARIGTGGTITSVTVFVRGHRRARATGSRVRRTIRVRHLRARRYRVKVRVRTKDGRLVTIRRTYRRCH